MLMGVGASAALFALYARGDIAWVLGFVALAPWLCALNTQRTFATTLWSAYLMSVAYTAATFAWFGVAIGSYTQVGSATGLAVLLIGAPLFQPQFFAFAWVRHAASSKYGAIAIALAGASAWVAAEWFIPKLLGDTLGYGLYPSRLLRQGADLGGTAGLTFLLILCNEGLAQAVVRRSSGLRAVVPPLVGAALVPLVMAAYGLAVLSVKPAPIGKPLRIGMVQSNMVNYEKQRQEKGVYAAVREILDLHYAMSYDAVERQHVDAVMWSETAYPTTFGHPKSETGAELDREILGIVKSAGVPFVFGTYDLDSAGEYNAAAFVEPTAGLLGLYRKTRLFPLTEYVPPWLDGPAFKRWLPWTGTWLPGNGARVFPLRLADGREIPVLPMICLDDVDTDLAISGARLGAQAILTMSNDAWFTDYEQGARLHLASAAFRSIETRLPQFRVTTNGYSTAIDPTGTVLARGTMGERTLVIGELQAQALPPTLLVWWGNWVGLAGTAFLVVLASVALWPLRPNQLVDGAVALADAATFPLTVVLLPTTARLAAGVLRGFARGALLCMAGAMLLDDNLRANTLAQMRWITGLFLAPEAAAWLLLRAFGAQANIEQGALVFTQGKRRLTMPLRDIAAVEPWRLPIPSHGTALRLASGARWSFGLALANPLGFARALAEAGGPTVQSPAASRSWAYMQTCLAMPRNWLDHPVTKFVLFPLVLALPAFRLHQYIAYGGLFGELYTFGLKAYITTLGLWWAAWAIGVLLCAAGVRAVIELVTVAMVALRPTRATNYAIATRQMLERIGLVALYLGLPAWLAVRILYG
jgi:apolipoprotein N-acyltransferase